ncbi:MAG TPA: hypothetical protein VF590_09315 [Isosphaeraceae bacterium]
MEPLRIRYERAELRWGWQAQRPLTQLLFGGALLAIGLFPIPLIVGWILHGGTLPMVLAWMTTMAPFGGWLMLDALRRGFFLAIDGLGGRWKLCFDRRAGRSEVEAFLRQAERLFGYQFGQAAG